MTSFNSLFQNLYFLQLFVRFRINKFNKFILSFLLSQYWLFLKAFQRSFRFLLLILSFCNLLRFRLLWIFIRFIGSVILRCLQQTYVIDKVINIFIIVFWKQRSFTFYWKNLFERLSLKFLQDNSRQILTKNAFLF